MKTKLFFAQRVEEIYGEVTLFYGLYDEGVLDQNYDLIAGLTIDDINRVIEELAGPMFRSMKDLKAALRSFKTKLGGKA